MNFERIIWESCEKAHWVGGNTARDGTADPAPVSV